jgi:putative hydrolase of the HAD superfamily
MRFDAVAFDLDGTLYPNLALYSRALPSMLAKARRLSAFNEVRQRIRSMGLRDAAYRGARPAGQEAFRALEARLAAARMGMSEAQAEAYIASNFYDYVEGLFARVRPYRGVPEALDALAGRGLRLAVLSDLPPRRKLELMGIAKSFEAALCSSESGFLKPAREPFEMLAAALRLSPERILYVGNNPRVDAVGARGAGMASALVARRASREADFTFFDWKRLVGYVLS